MKKVNLVSSLRIIFLGLSIAVIGLAVQQAFTLNSSYAAEDMVHENLEIILNEKLGEGYEILTIKHLDSLTREYFTKTYPNRPPGYICSSFRRPNITDCGVLLVNNKENHKLLVLAVLDFGSGKSEVIEAYKIERNYAHSHVFLYYSPKGRVVFDHEAWGRVKVRAAGFEVVFFEKSSILYFWKKDRLSHIWTSD